MQDAEEFTIDKEKTGDGKEGKKPRPIIKTAVDLQRLKVEKLMKNPDKPVVIPESHREKDFLQSVPSFVRNVMGSSAGAGSGEFHVYRHLRRKEYARQKHIQAKTVREQLDEDFQNKMEQNRLKAEAKTAKRRAKRQKKKQRMKQRGKKPKMDNNVQAEAEDASDDDDDGDNSPECSENENDRSKDDNINEKKDCDGDTKIADDNEGVQAEVNEESVEDVGNKGDTTTNEEAHTSSEEPTNTDDSKCKSVEKVDIDPEQNAETDL